MTTPKEQARGKYSVTLPPELAERAKAKSGPNGFSNYVEKALRDALVRDGMQEYARLRGNDPIDDVFEASEADLEDAA
ncbi:hypothetical protein ABZ468_07750 [Streptomyces sp. NPDC005708]|uniref:hypothetical protein n=1 Tax=Streptomyces sp. NPDC005708 TaxID=3154564 RepID=UPI0033F2411F